VATTPKALTQAEGNPARLGGRPFIPLRWPCFVGFLVLALKELDFLSDHLGARMLHVAVHSHAALMASAACCAMECRGGVVLRQLAPAGYQ
jgi:hypothetical protein